MWGIKNMGNKPKNDNGQEISFIDVKELYDAAYAEKAKAQVNLKAFQVLLDQAVLLDEAYRAQLMQVKPFQYKEAI